MSTKNRILFESPSVIAGEESEMTRKDFDFERKLGEGAFGQVWKVRHKVTGENYALKQVPKEKVKKIIDQFIREVRILYSLQHPHIIRLFNHFEDEKFFYLILEFAEGGSLFQKLHKYRSFGELEACQFFRDTVLAIEYLHAQVPSIIHRDIKPENILLTKDSRVLLTDFGWSNFNIDTRTTVCGTLEYLPPEIVENKGHGTAADVWCLGILLYEMLSGRSPFKSNTQKKMLSNISRLHPEFPRNFPLLAKDLISKMLEKDPHIRLTINQVKAHQWLTDIPPLKPVLSNTEFKPYKIINPQRIQDTKASSSKDVSISYSEISESFKKSIEVFTTQVQGFAEFGRKTKGMIEDIDQDLTGFISQQEELKAQVLMKEQELRQLYGKETQLKKEIEDSDLLHNSLSVSLCDDSLPSKIHEIKKELIEKSGTIGVYRKKAESYNLQLKDLEFVVHEKEDMIKSLKNRVEQLKNATKDNQQDQFEKLNELQITKDILNSRILRKTSDLPEDEGSFIEESKKVVQEQTSRVQGLSVKEKLDLLITSTEEKEKELLKLKNWFEDTKREILRDFRNQKAEVLEGINQTKKMNKSELNYNISLRKDELFQELNKARSQEGADVGNLSDIVQHRNYCLVSFM